MNTSQRLLVIAAVVISAVLGAYAHHRLNKAPDDFSSYTFTDTSGQAQRITAWRGKPLLVNFWASWCPPCLEELPLLNQHHAQLQQNGVALVGVALEKEADAKTTATRLSLNFPQLFGELAGFDLAIAMGNTTGGLPFNVLLNAEGRVVKTWAGPLKADDLEHLHHLLH